MKWIKTVIVDIVVTIVILLAVNLEIEWLRIVVIAYTILILLLKLIVYFSGGSPLKKKGNLSEAPGWFIHMLYAINVIVLLLYQWWIIAALWVVIWLFSWLIQKKSIKTN